MRIKLFPAVLVVTASLPVANLLQTSPSKTNAGLPSPGNEACASCHSEIYRSFLATPMAQASGPALKGFLPGEFDHKVSGVRYRVYERDGRVWMSYERGHELSGTREFLYFIGSGKKGRTYLFSDDRYLFEAPINWYTQENRWNMTPAYTEARANSAQTNLGILEARSGDLHHAVQLWQQAFQRVPYRSAIGMNLALAFCAAGQKDEARLCVERVLEFNPDYGAARQRLTRLDNDPGECGPKK